MSKIKAKASMKQSTDSNDIGKVNVNIKIKTLKPAKAVVYKDKHTRNEVFHIIAENTKLSKSQIEAVFEELNQVIEGHLKRRGSGEFIIPKIGIKIKRIKKKATKERSMISPLTGNVVTIASKPARLSVKLTALKNLKEAVDK